MSTCLGIAVEWGKVSSPSVAGVGSPELTCACSQQLFAFCPALLQVQPLASATRAHPAALATSGSSSTTEGGKETWDKITISSYLFPDLISHGNTVADLFLIICLPQDESGKGGSFNDRTRAMASCRDTGRKNNLSAPLQAVLVCASANTHVISSFEHILLACLQLL